MVQRSRTNRQLSRCAEGRERSEGKRKERKKLDRTHLAQRNSLDLREPMVAVRRVHLHDLLLRRGSEDFNDLDELVDAFRVRRASQSSESGRRRGGEKEEEGVPDVPGKKTEPCSSSPMMQPMDQRSARGGGTGQLDPHSRRSS